MYAGEGGVVNGGRRTRRVEPRGASVGTRRCEMPPGKRIWCSCGRTVDWSLFFRGWCRMRLLDDDFGSRFGAAWAGRAPGAVVVLLAVVAVVAGCAGGRPAVVGGEAVGDAAAEPALAAGSLSAATGTRFSSNARPCGVADRECSRQPAARSSRRRRAAFTVQRCSSR